MRHLEVGAYFLIQYDKFKRLYCCMTDKRHPWEIFYVPLAILLLLQNLPQNRFPFLLSKTLCSPLMLWTPTLRP